MQQERIDNLDLLRALAIVMVVLFHLPTQIALPADSLPMLLMQGWWSGVDLFFVLSGYLVGGLFWKELRARGSVQIGHFILRRALRTIPPYLVALHLIYLSRWVGSGHAGYDWHYLLFLQNYTGLSVFSVSWSLCIEEQFYLFAPLLLAYIGRWRAGWLLLALIPLPLVSRLILTEPAITAFGAHYVRTHNHCEGLLLGVWLSYLRYFHPQASMAFASRLKPVVLPCLIVVLGYRIFDISLQWESRWAYSLLACAFGLILFVGAQTDAWPLARNRAVKLIAASSYSLYLTHTYVLLLCRQIVLPRLPLETPLLQAVLALGLTFLAGYVFHLCVERPSFALRDRLLRPHAPARKAHSLQS